ncbi:hypothetical protein [Streptomyces sp. NPDC056045]|uniref:hypothetical protein n=1 Tax=Streptomyces sp. NPDC056045 TaxID=3345691 RepID=UPI0035E1B7F0
MRNLVGRTVAGVGATVAAVALSIGTASAEDAFMYSYHNDWTNIHVNLASMKFTANGDKWTVCDINNDGRRAMGSVYWSDSGGNHRLVTSVTGGSGTCKNGSHDFVESEQLTLQVWVQDGSDGKVEYRNTRYVTAS